MISAFSRIVLGTLGSTCTICILHTHALAQVNPCSPDNRGLIPLAHRSDHAGGAPYFGASFGEGLSVASNNLDFGLCLRSRIQARAAATLPETDKDASVDMSIRRLRLTLEGFAWKEFVTFKIQLGMATQDVDPVAPSIVRDAYVNFALARDFEVRAGQMKVPYGRQRVVSSGRLQMVDRSAITAELNLDRDVGLYAHSSNLFGLDGLLGYNAGIFGGDGRGRVSGGYGLLYTGRLELRAFGGKAAVELDEPDFEQGDLRLAFGLSAAYNHQTDRQRSTLGPVYAGGPWVNYRHFGLDWIMKWRGLSITGEGFLRDAVERERKITVEKKQVTEQARSGYGGFIQAGKFLTEHLEVSTRFGAMYGMDPGSLFEKEVGGGLSYYFLRHALKVQTDYFYLFERAGEGKHQLRIQLQIAP
jgi:Phosphate-selective porin O and P